MAIEVSRYFRDFLESDFKRKSAPRRRVVLHSDQGLRCGMRTRPYPTLDRALWDLLGQASGRVDPITIAPRQFTRTISPTLRKVIDSQIEQIPEEALYRVRQAVASAILSTAAQGQGDAEAWIESIQAAAATEIGERVVRPLVQRLDEPLRRSSYDFMDSLYSAESDMIRVVAQPLSAALPDALARLLARSDQATLDEVLHGQLQLSTTADALRNFFDGFITADAYMELRDIETFATVTEGYQLYLYLGAMKFRSAQYPLFFVPINITRLDAGVGYRLELLNQLFANRAGVEFALQELAEAKKRPWINPLNERILYLSPEQSILEVAKGLYNAVAAALGLGGQTHLGSNGLDAVSVDVSLSPVLHLCAYERGEESLVNDYEEIISLARQSSDSEGGSSPIVELFEKLVSGVLADNPVSIGRQIDAEWEGLPLVERMVFDSPIPLNEEQRRALLATRKPGGRIIVIEGPPGTGKSHTITAIAADCAFTKRSCLILSDKTEALQVVHDKLSSAMNRVRHVDDFPNPVLRLGTQDANFKRMVASQTISQVSAYAKSSKRNLPDLVAERDATAEGLKQAIAGTVGALGALAMPTVARMHASEVKLKQACPGAAAAILGLEFDDDVLRLAQAHEAQAAGPGSGNGVGGAMSLQDYMARLQKDFLRSADGSADAQDAQMDAGGMAQRVQRDLVLADLVNKHDARYLGCTGLFTTLSIEQARLIQSLVLQFQQLRMPVFGHLFCGSAVRALETQINALPVRQPLLLKRAADDLTVAARAAIDIDAALTKAGCGGALPNVWPDLAEVVGWQPAAKSLDAMLAACRRVPGLAEALRGQPAQTWTLAMTFLADWVTLLNAFDKTPRFDFVSTKSELERMNTSMMNAHVDGQLVDFVEDNRADAKTMAQLISQRQKFPEAKFDAVRSSFPIILAGIREFGEYMPLVPEMFDVVVIDEASQVSVAQALPALLRAKTIVVLGDSKQFSNVKSANASNAINDKYRANLVQFFERNVTSEPQALQRLAMFDVKRSVLDFCSLAANYSVMLKKHFRSYPELISYSSTTFYGGQLQALKLRTRPLDEVIRFEPVTVGERRVSRATNEAEADVIVGHLLEMLEEDSPPSVGVITPFREQHTLLQKRLLGHPRAQEFEKRLKLRVWTADSCQGEERSIIFYSLVATPGNDALNYVFPTALDNAQQSVEEKLKVQRLNVSFSRAQDCIWILHSQDLALYKGALAQALHHYQGILARKSPDASQTDPSSPMEAKVLGWLQQTRFVQAQPEDVEIIPQFPIGDYLRQLDPTYQHPAWRVDFLLVCRTAKGVLHIVIEYDGFEFHFDTGRASQGVNVGNHERYLKESDVERQLTLESYGYRFLRINRFNLGRDAVGTLDERLARLVEMATGEQQSQLLERLRSQAEGMTTKKMKQCMTCSNISPLEDFFDKTLKRGQGGYGRKCMNCKLNPPPMAHPDMAHLL